MTEFSQARRRLLRNAAAWVGGIAGVAAVKPARALETYTVGRNSVLGLSYSNHCGPASEHAGLVAQLQTQLQSDPAAATITQTCPICGCPVTVSR